MDEKESISLMDEIEETLKEKNPIHSIIILMICLKNTLSKIEFTNIKYKKDLKRLIMSYLKAEIDI